MSPGEVAKGSVDAVGKVHRALGPGWLESAYQTCLAHDLQFSWRAWRSWRFILPVAGEKTIIKSALMGRCAGLH